jgi:hypothetical protein
VEIFNMRIAKNILVNDFDHYMDPKMFIPEQIGDSISEFPEFSRKFYRLFVVWPHIAERLNSRLQQFTFKYIGRPRKPQLVMDLNISRRALSVVRNDKPEMDFVGCDLELKISRACIRARLCLPHDLCNADGIFGGFSGAACCIQRAIYQPHSPSADAKGNKASDRHNPLRNAVSPKEVVIRFGLAILGSVGIMFFCGWLSWCAGPLDNRLRFWGGLWGGLGLCSLLFYWLIGAEIIRALAIHP